MQRRKFILAATGLSSMATIALFARRTMGGNGMMGNTRRDEMEGILGSRSNSSGKTAGAFFNPLKIPPELRGEMHGGVRRYDLMLQTGTSEFFPGVKTVTWGVNGPYLGPTIRLKKGEEVALRWHNRLPESTTMHGHGMHLPATMDGNVHQTFAPGTSWTARYKVDQRACTNWYHPHTYNRTAEQVMLGLGGLIYIDDEESEKLPLPKRYGIDDIPVVVQDRLFTRNGQFAYPRNMMTVMHGFGGDTLLVNGTIAPYHEVEAGWVRLRLLNASNARVYRFAVEGASMHLIAGDNSFLEVPIEMKEILLSPAERAEVMLDLRQLKGKRVLLRDQESGAGVLELRVRRDAAVQSRLPRRLTRLERTDAVQAKKKRRFDLQVGGPGRLLINDKKMDPNRIDERVPLDQTEVWEVHNVGMGMGRMMGMNHNFHMHGGHFRILSRNGSAQSVRPWESGYKDTVFLAPGDRVQLLVRHRDYRDIKVPFMYHCHVLEHEDAGMMGQFVVV